MQWAAGVTLLPIHAIYPDLEGDTRRWQKKGTDTEGPGWIPDSITGSCLQCCFSVCWPLCRWDCGCMD